MATEENPLLSLDASKQQQLVDLVESNDIEDIATKTGLTRRQILGIGATLAGSGALGGYAATEAINPAQAQADTGDSDGNVGLPTDRVDVFADGVDSNSLSTDEVGNDGSPVDVTDQMNTKEPSTVGTTMGIGSGGDVTTGDAFSISDESQVVLNDNGAAGETVILLRADSTGSEAVIVQAGTEFNKLVGDGDIVTSDTDGNHCVFFDIGPNAVVLKNRTGGSSTYTVTAIGNNTRTH